MNPTRTAVLRSTRLRGEAARSVLGNIGARVVALVSVAVVTALVARTGGAGDVGLLALMRVLPGLVGVVAACGLPGAMGYFVAGPDGGHPRLWPTVVTAMAVGAVGGVVAWLVLVPVLHTHLMSTTDVAVVLATGATVATQLPVAVGKPCLQALGDARGSNLVTASEEAAFVPAMLLLWVCGLRSGWLLVGSLLVADVLVAALAWARIRRRVHEQGGVLLGRVDLGLARRVVVFGLRSQVGGILSLLNLRLDVVILGALTGPAPVGVYVVASKYAELLRLPGLALTWVSYPRYAKRTPDPDAPTPPLALPGLPRLPGALGLGALAALVVAATAAFVLPFVYGDDFRSAVWPAVWIALGLAVQPAAGMASGFLLGSGSPGLNSLILGAGFGITVALDLWLIPRHGSLGAAWASATAYAATDLLLVGAWRRRSRGRP